MQKFHYNENELKVFKILMQKMIQSERTISMVWSVVWSSPLKSGHPSNPGIEGLQFQPPNIIVCRRFEPLFYKHHLSHPPTHLWQNVSSNIAPMKYQINTKINLCDKVILSFLEELWIQLIGHGTVN